MMMPLFPGSGSSLYPLRPYQSAAIEAVRHAVKEGHKRIILQCPTGAGKTVIAAHIVDGSLAKGKRPLFTCPAITLVNQTLKSFEAQGIRDIGVIQAQHERTDWLAQMQIASVQTLIRRALPEVDLILIDEAHLNWVGLAARLDSPEWKNKVVIGLTATPWAKGMGLRWTKLIVAVTMSTLIGDGYLSPFVVYAPAEEPDLSGVKIRNGDYEEASVLKVMNTQQITADVVKTWIEKAENRPTFLYGVNRAHAQALQDEFIANGIPCGYIDGNSDDESRKRTFSRLENGEDLIIASVGCLTTGVDIPMVSCMIDAAPTRSEILHVQKTGRVLRSHDSKERALILDHAGNTLRLGLVTDIHHDHLDTRKPKEKGEAYEGEKPPPKPRKCPSCGSVVARGLRVCPSCGNAFPAMNTVEHTDGELVLYGSGQKAKKREYSLAEKQEWYAGLLYIARRREKSDGLAWHRFFDRFGHYPAGYKKQPRPPSKEVEDWDLGKRIRAAKSYAKSQEKRKTA